MIASDLTLLSSANYLSFTEEAKLHSARCAHAFCMNTLSPTSNVLCNVEDLISVDLRHYVQSECGQTLECSSLDMLPILTC